MSLKDAISNNSAEADLNSASSDNRLYIDAKLIQPAAVATPSDGSLSAPSICTTTALNEVSQDKLKRKLKPGYAYIFNHESFNDENTLRKGTEVDVKRLTETFLALNLVVQTYHDATLQEYEAIVREMEKKDFSDQACIVICILSHGTEDDKIAAKDGNYTVNKQILFPILCNKTLFEKPKIFFIQACKGARVVNFIKYDSLAHQNSPNEILKCYSTFEGYVAYRTHQGSDFINSLTSNLNKNGKSKDIEQIMKDVMLEVKTITNGQQIPSVLSTLTSKFCFGDYK